MRIGLVCPYSLSVPGGVQGQVLGLARSLRVARPPHPGAGAVRRAAARRVGHAARQQHAPPRPTARSSPLAPDLSAQLRFIRALRDEDFDVLHLHEPMVPGPAMTAGLVQAGAARRHVPRRRGAAPPTPGSGRRCAGSGDRLDVACAVSEDARELAERFLGGELRGAVQRHRGGALRQATPTPTDRPTVLFLRSPRAPQGPRRAARGPGLRCHPTSACGWRGRGPRRRGCGSGSPATPASSGSAG